MEEGEGGASDRFLPWATRECCIIKMGEYWKRSWFERKNHDYILDILSEKEWDAILSWCRPEKETDAYLIPLWPLVF